MRRCTSLLLLMALVDSAAARYAFVASRLPSAIPSSRVSSIASTTGPKFCERCGSPTTTRVPEGDERERACCTNSDCGHIAYQNPKVVVACVPTWEDRILLCERAIPPCEGKWGYPQGFLELGETSREGAARETMEEAGAQVNPADATLLAVYDLPGQVQMVYTAPMTSGAYSAGMESSEVGLFGWDQIPWEELAFPTVNWALEYARDFACIAAGENKRPTGPIIPQQRTKLYVDGNWKVVDDFVGH
uniref:Nudix hydrolase domain-containing protein n=1 Tax=Odontella aurita TaxID=265563 RepID=A0A7S4KCY9_9STRA|mmetsp:Transcript_9489/g.28489  ORF Transcript_9489/g.28489 Transcript_9489/m.28489 type:complete len:247 (+) Transcript_9489:92-832(+)